MQLLCIIKNKWNLDVVFGWKYLKKRKETFSICQNFKILHDSASNSYSSLNNSNMNVDENDSKVLLNILSNT